MHSRNVPENTKSILYNGTVFYVPESLYEAGLAFVNDQRIKQSERVDFLYNLEQSFRDSDYNQPAIESDSWVSRFNIIMDEYFSKKKKERSSTPSFENAEEVAVVVHQAVHMQESTASFIESKLPGIPTALLVANTFPVASEKLLKKADAIQWSNNGQFEVPSKAKTFHLFGSFCKMCVSDAIDSITSLNRPASEQTDIYVHAALSVETNDKFQLRSMSYLMADKKDFSFDDALSYARAIGFEDVEMQKVVQETKYGPSYTFTFEKPPGSGKKHSVHIVPN